MVHMIVGLMLIACGGTMVVLALSPSFVRVEESEYEARVLFHKEKMQLLSMLCLLSMAGVFVERDLFPEHIVIQAFTLSLLILVLSLFCSLKPVLVFKKR